MNELYKHGACPSTRDNYCNSPLDYLITHSSGDDCLTTIEFLVEECHVFLDGKNDHGMTALHLATLAGNRNLVSYLIESRASLNVLDARKK